MPEKAAHVILVPGAWMGGWIWEPTVQWLRARDIDAEMMTLRGLEPGRSGADIARVSLEDHVQQLVDVIYQTRADKVILVSHSYSGVVVAAAATGWVPRSPASFTSALSYLSMPTRSSITGALPMMNARKKRQRSRPPVTCGLRPRVRCSTTLTTSPMPTATTWLRNSRRTLAERSLMQRTYLRQWRSSLRRMLRCR